MIVTLIRHTSVAVPAGVCYGQSDVGLSDRFAEEAAAVRQSLAAARFDAVYASPLRRCLSLAQYCGFASPRIDARLMEMNFGDWEMQAWEAIADPQLARWYADWIGEAPTGGESWRAMIARVERFADELIDGRHGEFERVAVFTHAGVIRAFAVALGLFAADAAFELKVDYGDSFDFTLR